MTTLALKLTTVNANSAASAMPAARRTSLRRVLAHRWDMIGVLAVMGSSASYAVWTMLHLA